MSIYDLPLLPEVWANIRDRLDVRARIFMRQICRAFHTEDSAFVSPEWTRNGPKDEPTLWNEYCGNVCEIGWEKMLPPCEIIQQVNPVYFLCIVFHRHASHQCDNGILRMDSFVYLAGKLLTKYSTHVIIDGHVRLFDTFDFNLIYRRLSGYIE